MMNATATMNQLAVLIQAKLKASHSTPKGYYAVNGKRYYLNEPTQGKWKGWRFLSTGSDYHDRRTIAMYNSDGDFVKGSDNGQAVMAAILADPVERMQEYGSITGRCAQCGRKLEDPTSVELGIGPICLSKLLG